MTKSENQGGIWLTQVYLKNAVKWCACVLAHCNEPFNIICCGPVWPTLQQFLSFMAQCDHPFNIAHCSSV